MRRRARRMAVLAAALALTLGIGVIAPGPAPAAHHAGAVTETPHTSALHAVRWELPGHPAASDAGSRASPTPGRLALAGLLGLGLAGALGLVLAMFDQMMRRQHRTHS